MGRCVCPSVLATLLWNDSYSIFVMRGHTVSQNQLIEPGISFSEYKMGPWGKSRKPVIAHLCTRVGSSISCELIVAVNDKVLMWAEDSVQHEQTMEPVVLLYAEMCHVCSAQCKTITVWHIDYSEMSLEKTWLISHISCLYYVFIGVGATKENILVNDTFWRGSQRCSNTTYVQWLTWSTSYMCDAIEVGVGVFTCLGLCIFFFYQQVHTKTTQLISMKYPTKMCLCSSCNWLDSGGWAWRSLKGQNACFMAITRERNEIERSNCHFVADGTG